VDLSGNFEGHGWPALATWRDAGPWAIRGQNIGQRLKSLIINKLQPLVADVLKLLDRPLGEFPDQLSIDFQSQLAFSPYPEAKAGTGSAWPLILMGASS